MWKWILVIVGVLVALVVGLGVWAKSSGALDSLLATMNPESKPLKVVLSKVDTGDVVRIISAPGQIEPRTKVEISAQVSARIVEIPQRENALVHKGDVVLRLDDRDVKAALDSARANHSSAQAQLERAKAEYARASREFRRAKDLYETKDLSQADLESAETAHASAEANLRSGEYAVDIARANIDRAEKDLDNTIVRSPFDGMIVKVNAEVGELVVVGTLNNPGSVIMEIDDLTTMLLKHRIDEANVQSVRDAQTAKVFVNALPDRPITGKVERVALIRDLERDGTANFKADIVLDRPADLLLRSGMTANAEIAVEKQSGVLRIPSHAVLDRSIDDLPKAVVDAASFVDKTKRFAQVVFVKDAAKAKARIVKVGISDQTHSVVLDGLKEGEVVVSGPFKILGDLKDDRLVEEDTGKGPASKPAAPPKT